MSKEFVEELFAPRGELHFSGERAGVWVGAQDVEGYAPDDGEVLRPIIFAGSGVVLKEDDVERPMQGVFHAPMRAFDLKHAFGREALGEGDVVDVGTGLAVAQPPLGFDAPERGEARKGWRIREASRSRLRDASPAGHVRFRPAHGRRVRPRRPPRKP